MQAILDSISDGRLSAKPVLLITNNSDCRARERAIQFGFPTAHISSVTHPDDKDRVEAIIEALESSGANIIVLAGYMKKLPEEAVEKYRGRILNIHPALLPKFGGAGMYGINVHEAVLEAGEKFSGATVHLVDEQYDRGKILTQASVPVLDGDTPESLAERVLKVEHELFPETLRKIANGEIEL